jgi:hypothetical protein
MGWSKQANDAMNLQPGPSEIEQQAGAQTGGAQVIEALRAVDAIQRGDRLELDDHTVVYQ